MYMTPELRTGMFGIDPLDLGIDLVTNSPCQAHIAVEILNIMVLSSTVFVRLQTRRNQAKK
jgi:hypothetical protein